MASGTGISTITHRADFVAAASSGHKFVKPSVIIQCRSRAGEPAMAQTIRAGFTATRKLGGAVVRNRAKRRLRSAARALLPLWGREGCDYVFIARPQTLRITFDDLIDEMKHALKRLSSLTTLPKPTPEL